MEEFHSYKKTVLITQIYKISILCIFCVETQEMILPFFELIPMMILTGMYFYFVLKVLESDKAILLNMKKTEKTYLLADLFVKVLELLWALCSVEYIMKQTGIMFCIWIEVFMVFLDFYFEYKIGKILKVCTKEMESGIRTKKREELVINDEKEEFNRYISLYLVLLAFWGLSFLQIVLYSVEGNDDIILILISTKGVLLAVLVNDYVKKIKNSKVLNIYVKRYSYTTCIILYIIETGIYFMHLTNHWVRLGVLAVSIIIMLIFYVKLCVPFEKIVSGMSKAERK